VILRQAADIVVEGVEARGRQHSGLAHAASAPQRQSVGV
jgi:hypothetical protein